MLLTQDLEFKIEKEVMNYLIKGRSGWDVPHTIASVYWMKYLIQREGGNPRILVPTMYEHDIGYFGLFPEGCNYDSVEAKRAAHMIIGAKMADEINKKLGFSDAERHEIYYLISVHDKIEELTTHNERLVMEADSLAQIDQYRVPSTFRSEEYVRLFGIRDYMRFIESFQEKRLPLITTKTGVECVKKLLPYALEFGKLKK